MIRTKQLYAISSNEMGYVNYKKRKENIDMVYLNTSIVEDDVLRAYREV